MLIIGCDFHSRFQQIAMLDPQTGEIVERRLEHESGEAERFYRSLPRPVRVGLESSGHAQWFERLLAELGHELWVGDAAHSGRSCTKTEDGYARCFAHSRFADDQPLSTSLEAIAGRARRAAAVGSSAETGVGSDQGEEPVADASHEPGRLHTTKALGQRWPSCIGRPDTRTVDQPPSKGVAANVGSAQWFGRGVGSSRWGRSTKACRRRSIDDSSWSWSGDGPSLRIDAGTGRALSPQ